MTEFIGKSNIGLDALLQQEKAHQAQNPTSNDPLQIGGPVAAPPITNEQVIADVAALIRDVLCMVLNVNSPKTTLGDAQIKGLAAAWGKVATKYQIDLANLKGAYVLEVAAVAQTAIIGMAVYNGLGQELGKTVNVQAATASDQKPKVVIEPVKARRRAPPKKQTALIAKKTKAKKTPASNNRLTQKASGPNADR